jgi:hypothetical protein
LAEYAKCDADVLFIINYPAYMQSNDCYDNTHMEAGLGFKYKFSDIPDNGSLELKRDFTNLGLLIYNHFIITSLNN